MPGSVLVKGNNVFKRKLSHKAFKVVCEPAFVARHCYERKRRRAAILFFFCCMTHVPDSMLVPNRFFSSVSVDRRRVRLSTFRTELRAFILNLNKCTLHKLSPVSLQYYLCKICCTLDIETMLLNVTTQI